MRTLIASDDWDDWEKTQAEYRANYRASMAKVGNVLRQPVLRVFGTIGGARLAR